MTNRLDLQNELTQIEQAKQEWEATVDSLAELIFLLDHDWRVIRANRTIEEWGLAKVNEIQGKQLPEVLHSGRGRPSSYLKLLLSRAYEQLLQGEVVEYEFEDRILKKYLFIKFRPISTSIDTAKDKIITSFATVIIQDITERKRTEIALQKANEALVELNATKDRFFSIVAHDLKVPFQPLLGMSELLPELVDNSSPEAIKEMGHSINRSAKHVFELLENLLQWSRLQMGRIEINPERCDLQQIINRNLVLLADNALTKKISLTSQLTDSLFVWGDEQTIDTVIRNLLSNALKFTPTNGQITVTAVTKTHNLATRQQGNQVVVSQAEVSVTDTGVGISAEDQEKLFRVDLHHTTSGTAQEQGTGLGLIICQEMIQKNRGHIWVESELGKGTSIKFTLPLEP